MNTVLVIGCHLSGLGVIRALGTYNLRIIALSYELTDMGTTSKYVSEKHRIPHPTREEKAFIQYLLDNGPHWGGALIFDCDDHVAVSLSRHKDLLTGYYRIVTADWEIFTQFIDKDKTYQLARECGVPYPKTFTPKSIEEIARIKQEVEYPCIIKAVRGHEFKSKFNHKVFEISTPDELEEKFRLCLESKMDVVVQEVIPGTDSNIYKMQAYINSKGKMVGKFFYRKLRQNPPQFGVTRVAISTEKNLEVEELSARMLAHSKFRGMCNFEFKKDERDGKLKLIEVNVRMSRINWLPTFCGMNFPWIIYLDLIKDEQIMADDYRKNVYIIELYSDLLTTLFRHNRENFTMREYIQPYLAKDKTFVDLSLQDIKPFLKRTIVLPIICTKGLN